MPYNYILSATIILIAILALIFIFISIQYYGFLKNKEKHLERVVLGENVVKTLTNKNKKRVKHKKRNVFLRIKDDYIFLGGTLRKLLMTVFVGYAIAVLIYFLLSKNILLSLILGLFYLVVYYNLLENNLKKRRMEYIKGFVSALDIVSASFQVGNTLEESLKTVSTRKNINSIVRREFTSIRTSLNVGDSLSEAMDKFAKRNVFYEEPTMFAIIMQFIAKSGGENIDVIFKSLKESLNRKSENYSMIEGNIFIYNALFNVMLIIVLGASLVANFFLKGFYEDLSTPFGLVRAFASVLTTIFSVYLFKGFIKKAAEGG